MERTFTIRTEPHKAHIGGTTLLFEPEVIGAAFVEAYAELEAVQSRAAEATAPENTGVNLSALADIDAGMISFIARFLLPESREAFTAMHLPQRVLIELIEWVAELYGGGSGNPEDGTGPSSG